MSSWKLSSMTISKEKFVKKRSLKILFMKNLKITVQLSHKDVQLDYFRYIQLRMSELNSGDALIANPEGFTNPKGQMVLKFSSHFRGKLEKLRNDGYHIK